MLFQSGAQDNITEQTKKRPLPSTSVVKKCLLLVCCLSTADIFQEPVVGTTEESEPLLQRCIFNKGSSTNSRSKYSEKRILYALK